jgi:myo-inositol-1-phosphate synthase
MEEDEMKGRVRVGIVGVGNCASSLVQGIEYYAKARTGERVPGLMHVSVGPYHVSDVTFSCAFDVDANKVGRELADAIWEEPNNTTKFSDVTPTGVSVMRGPTLDGLGIYYRQEVTESAATPVDVGRILRETDTDVLVNYLPVGSEEAARFYAEQALEAGVAFINCMPVFIASKPDWAARFEAKRVPIIGDDIKSQIGATISHRVLSKLFEDRGVIIDNTYQLNFGGNMDFMNMLERERLQSKKISKTQSVTSQITAGIDPSDIHIGPSDHVPWLRDRKWAYIRIEGREFGDVPVSMELKLEVWDSPNSAGVVIDAVRCAKLALDRGMGGPLLGPSAYFMKSPPVQHSDSRARELVEEFIAAPRRSGNGRVEGNGRLGVPHDLSYGNPSPLNGR